MHKKNLIIPTGFYNTGSSVITNILQEIEGIGTVEGNNEWRVLYDPDGIRDLEYHLLENPHRQNTSYAVKRFKKYIDFNSDKMMNHHYEKMCDGNFKKISYDYIKAISDFKYLGVSHIDIKEKGKIFWFIERCYAKGIRTFFSSNRPVWVRGSLMPRKTMQYAGTYKESAFYNATQKYVGTILDYVNKEDYEYLVADQFFPPSAINPYLNYIPDEYNVKVFVVDRDPRDLFYNCKYYLHTKAIPTYDVKTFCKWYKWTREQSKKNSDSSHVMRVQFEDAIYEYKDTRRKILQFCGLEDSKCLVQKKYFDPMKSINNTQAWKRYSGHEDELKYIEQELREYCYSFDEKKITPDFDRGKMFDC